MGEKVYAKKLATSEERQMTTAKELAAATQAQRLAEGYRKRFEAASVCADNADDVVCSLAQTLLRRASGSPQPEPTPIPADTRDVVRRALGMVNTHWQDSFAFDPAMSRDLSFAGGRNRAWQAVKDALAALEAVPAEKVVGYGVLRGEWLGYQPVVHHWSKDDAVDALKTMSAGSRLVRLVAEDE